MSKGQLTQSHFSFKGDDNKEEEDAWRNNPELLKLLTPEQLEDYKGVFDMIDADNSGSIDVQELSHIMRTLG